MRAIAIRGEFYFITLIMAALMLMVGYGCGDDDDLEISPGDARIRVTHLSSDTRNVDVFVNGQQPAAVTNLAFKETRGYLDLAPGSYTFNISATGGTPAKSALDVGPLALMGDTAYTAVAFNTFAAPIEALALVDDLSNPGAGNIRLRPIHAAPGVGQVDIWEVSSPINPIPLYTDVNFRDVEAYAVLPAGTYTLGFDVNNDAVPDLTFSTGAIPAGSIINVFAVNDGADVFLIAQFQDGTTVQIDPI
jgi:hypothetical protein